MTARLAIPATVAIVVSLGAAAPVHAQEASDDAAPGPDQAEQVEAAPEEPQPPNMVEANERVARGEALFEQGDFDAALAEFERAYEVIGEHPARYIVLYNIGQAHERRFRYDLAMRYYRRYLEEGGPQAEDRATVEATIRTLEGLLATIHVTVNVPEAEVWVGDRQVGTAPGEVLVPGGRHVVEVRAPGYVPAQQEVQVPPRSEQTVAFELTRLADEYRGLSPVYFWGSTGLAVVALGLGVTFGLMASAEHSSLEDMAADPARRWLVTDEDNARVARLALIADIGFGAAVLFAATAMVLAFQTDWGGGDEPPSQARLRVAPAVGQGTAGLTVSGAL